MFVGDNGLGPPLVRCLFIIIVPVWIIHITTSPFIILPWPFGLEAFHSTQLQAIRTLRL